MKIDPKGHGVQPRTTPAEHPQVEREARRGAGAPQRGPAPADDLQISERARSMARGPAEPAVAGAEAAPGTGAVDPQRLEEIRAKIASGFYENEAVLERVADRLLEDLG